MNGIVREPVAIAAAIRAVILAATAFGLRWDAAQIAALMIAVEAVLGLITRQSVTPGAAPVLPVGTVVNGGAGVVTER